MPNKHFSVKLLTLIIFILLTSLLNFHRSADFEYADLDGFQYLSFSKSVLSGTHFYENTIRSPILAFIILPDLVLARVEMIIFHLIAVTLVYLITYELTKNENASLFSSLLYGVNWWMTTFLVTTLSDLPAMVFFMFSLLLWIRGGKYNTILSGTFAGLAFITRFDTAVILLPIVLFALNKKFKYDFLTPLFLIAVPFELLTSWLTFGKLVYPPLEFFNVNFVYGLAPALAKGHETVFFVSKKIFELSPLLVFASIVSLLKIKNPNYFRIFSISAFAFLVFSFTPTPDNRIFMVKLIPLMSILSAYTFLLIHDKLKKPFNYYLIAAVSLIYIIYNLILIFSVQYPVWKLSETPCLNGIMCTNAPPIVNYYCEKNAIDIHQSGSKHINTNPELDKNSTVFFNLKRCDYLIYYNVSFGYEDSINEMIKSRYALETATNSAFVYNLKSPI